MSRPLSNRSALPDHARAIRHALTDVRRVCTELGLLDGPRSFQRQPRGLTIRCPWHDDRSPSCSVRLADDGTIAVHCFACDKGGDVLSLIAIVRGLDVQRDFREILRAGAELAGLWGVVAELDAAATPPTTAGAPRMTVAQARAAWTAKRQTPKTSLPRDDDRNEDGLSDALFHEIASALLALCPLSESEEVRAYLAGRKLLELAQDAGWGALPAPPRQPALVEALVRRFNHEVVAASGLAYKRFHEDRTLKLAWDDHRLVIPYRAPGVDGAIHTVQRRLVRPPRENGEQKFVFPRGRGKPIHPYLLPRDIEELSTNAPVAFVEGAPDTLALRALCQRSGRAVLVLGIPGVKNWRPEWAAFAKGRTALLALDADRAGDEAIATIHRDLHAARAIKRWRPKQGTGKDWAEHLAGANE
jgi:DNA primase